MTLRNALGIALIAAVLAVIGWFLSVSPGQQAALRAAVRDRPPALPCVWSQPWTDPAFALSGWSQPQAWWHQPKIKVLWSNARTASIAFNLPRGMKGDSVTLGIQYPAVAATVDVTINGQRAGTLDRNAKGNHDPHVFTWRLSPLPADGIVDIRFITPNAVLHANDGRYLGMLLDAVRVCP